MDELHAVEMEGAGAGAAASLEQSRRSLGLLMVRGISDEPRAKRKRKAKDESGKEQRKQWKKYAATAAAAFVRALLLSLPEDSGTESPRRKTITGAWNSILAAQEEIPVVIPDFRIQSFKSPWGLKKLPVNVPVVGVQDAMAVGQFTTSFSRAYPSLRIRLFPASDFGPRSMRSSFMSVGGPSVNAITREYLPLLDSQFRVAYPQHKASDGENKYEPRLLRGRLVKDYGFIVIAPNPYHSLKTVCIVFGIWPQGTLAAMEALTNTDCDSEFGRKFLNRIKSNRAVVGVLEVKIQDLNQGIATFIDVRDVISPPRGTAMPLSTDAA
jgi:hypothetical protein